LLALALGGIKTTYWTAVLLEILDYSWSLILGSQNSRFPFVHL